MKYEDCSQSIDENKNNLRLLIKCFTKGIILTLICLLLREETFIGCIIYKYYF
jgi:hypothetical protein